MQAAGLSVAALLLAPVLRADHYVFRNGPLATPDASLGLQLHPQGMLRKPWRLAAGQERSRLILWGDSTIKRRVGHTACLPGVARLRA